MDDDEMIGLDGPWARPARPSAAQQLGGDGVTPRGRRRRAGVGLGLGALAAAAGGGSYAAVAVAASAASPATAASQLAAVRSQSAAPEAGSSTPSGTSSPGSEVPLRRRPSAAALGPFAGRGIFGVVTAPPGSGASSMTITEADGSSVTISTTGATAYTSAPGGGRFGPDGPLGVMAPAGPMAPIGPAAKAAKKATAADVKVGDDVAVTPTSSTAGSASPTAASVVIVPPRVSGTVVSLNGDTLTLRNSLLIEEVVTVSASTSYEKAGTQATAAAVVPGATVVASGTLDSAQTGIDAAVVDVLPTGLAGKVSAPSASGFTLTPASGGQPIEVVTGSGTRYRAPGGAGATVKAGETVLVEGYLQSDGSLAASDVAILPAGLTAPGGRGWGRFAGSDPAGSDPAGFGGPGRFGPGGFGRGGFAPPAPGAGSSSGSSPSGSGSSATTTAFAPLP